MSDRELSPALVIGTGLVGTSVALAMAKAGVEVHLQDSVPSHARVAASMGAGTTSEPDLLKVRLVVIAVPPESLPEVISASLAKYPSATVTDVGSVKGTVLAALRKGITDLSRYVGSHPMAGSQHTGPLTARADLFADRTWIITPHDTSAASAVLDVQALAAICGARRVTMGAAHHDEAVAQVSHLPHLVSVLVAGTLNKVPAEHLQLAGQGIRDVTRIAGSDPVLWGQIIGANADAVATQLRAFQADLADLIARLGTPELAGVLERGTAGARALPGKHGQSATEYASVVVEIPDEPGALARLFADIEAAGVNVEDLSIEHDPGREVGWLAVQVAPERADQLSSAMSAAGWTVRDRDPEL